mmetsp:Transcript_88341/g.248835  ORF Transcript_88341/g.248835 Transcript_88341/m.248835 type:complete len:738 (-) Transcript_88341:299-2512(-)
MPMDSWARAALSQMGLVRGPHDSQALREVFGELASSGAKISDVDVEIRATATASQRGDDSWRLRGPILEPPESCGREPSVLVYIPSKSCGDGAGAEIVALSRYLLPLHVAVFCVDPSESAAEAYSPRGVSRIVEYLRCADGGSYKCVALWGHSEGAAAALHVAAQDPSLAAIVCDSACISASNSVVADCLKTYFTDVKDRFSSSGLVPRGGAADSPGSGGEPWLVDVARCCFVAALFIHPEEDPDIPFDHTQALRAAYNGEKKLLSVPGGTSRSRRPTSIVAQAALFLVRALLRDTDSNPTLAEPMQRLLLATEMAAEPASPGGKALSKVVKAPNCDQTLRALQRCDVSDEDFCRGLLSVAVNACPAMERFGFKPVLSLRDINGAGIRRMGAPKDELRVLQVDATARLCAVEDKAAIAWVARDGLNGGVVHFAVLSSVEARVTAVKVKAAGGVGTLAEESIVEAKSCDVIGGMRASVELLAAERLELATTACGGQRQQDGTAKSISLVMTSRGGVALRVGDAHVCERPAARGDLPYSYCSRTVWQAHSVSRDQRQESEPALSIHDVAVATAACMRQIGDDRQAHDTTETLPPDRSRDNRKASGQFEPVDAGAASGPNRSLASGVDNGTLLTCSTLMSRDGATLTLSDSEDGSPKLFDSGATHGSSVGSTLPAQRAGALDSGSHCAEGARAMYSVGSLRGYIGGQEVCGKYDTWPQERLAAPLDMPGSRQTWAAPRAF